MHRGGSLRGGLCGLSLIAAMALGGGVAVAHGVQRSAMAASLRGSLQREAFPGNPRLATASFDAGRVRGSGADMDAAATDGGESSAVAAELGGLTEDVADAGSTGLGAASAERALFREPSWPYTAPTFDECFVDPVVQYRVDGVSPPEGSPCDVD